MESKLIFIPFAFDPAKRTGVNMENSSDAYSIYCKSFCTALVSLKLDNPDCDVALVCNIAPPPVFSDVLTTFDINVYIYPFAFFTFPSNYTWSLAFYKLSALYSVVNERNYDYYCYLDADVISNASLDPIWEECRDNILLYDINHGLNVQDYQGFLREASEFTGKYHYITHYGGEFFAASKSNALIFLEECLKIYNNMIRMNFQTTYGDEFILSLAAANLRHNVKNSGAYIFRYWTGQFYLTSTRHVANPVSIMHLPAEKNLGFIKIFDRYIAKGKFPDKKTIYRLCHIDHPYYLNVLKLAVKKTLHKV